jgi:hypothetical protein
MKAELLSDSLSLRERVRVRMRVIFTNSRRG